MSPKPASTCIASLVVGLLLLPLFLSTPTCLLSGEEKFNNEFF